MQGRGTTPEVFLGGVTGGTNQVKKYSPNIPSRTPSRGHQASSQSGLGVGYKLQAFSSSKKLRGLSVVSGRSSSISIQFTVSNTFA